MSVFTKPFEDNEKIVKAISAQKDADLFLHFLSRAYNSFVTRLTPTGDGDGRMFRRMPEYLFNNGMFGVFERDGTLHAWLCGGVGGIDEYGYNTSYILYSANGKNEDGSPVTSVGNKTEDRIELSAGDVVLFRANRMNYPIFRIVYPIIVRMMKTVRSIDNVTGKRGLSLFGTIDAKAKDALNDIEAQVENGTAIHAVKSPDVSSQIIRPVDLFGGAGGLSISDLWESERHFESILWETIGENTTAFEKKERLNIPEVEVNDERISHGIFGVARQEMQDSIDKVNAKWGVNWKLPEPEPIVTPDPEPEPDKESEDNDENENA